jgi:hypothetical protein
MSGYDGIVFIDLWKNLSPFHTLIKELNENKKKIYKKSEF